MNKSMSPRNPFAYFIIMMGCAIQFIGCVTQTAPQSLARFDKSKYSSIQIIDCVDRSGYSGSRDLAKEATRALKEKISATELFKLEPEANLIITCDIEKFSEGSVVKRWLLPGWGVTRADISVMIWEKADSKILATFKSQTEVSSGGFYTVGADYYVIGVALNNIVNQLQLWVENKNPKK